MSSPGQQRGRVPRFRLLLAAIVLVPAFMALVLAMAAGSVLVVFRSHTKLVQVAANDGTIAWQGLGELQGMPAQLATASDGSLWTKTRWWASLARYQNGRWEAFRHDAFGTRHDAPRHDFAIAGNRLWAVIDDKLVHFDGHRWQSQPIPQPAADHVLAALQDTVWVLGNDGTLRNWGQGEWKTSNLRATIADAAWDEKTPDSAPRLVTAVDGSLWLCSRTVWRRSAAAWAPVQLANMPLGNVELLGYADRKLWFDDGQGLLWIADNAAASGRFTHGQVGLQSHGNLHGVYEINGDVCASGSGGIYVLQGGRWELKWPAPKGVCRCEEAVGTKAGVYAIAIDLAPTPALWLALPMAAVISGAALWAVRRFLKLRDSFLALLNRRLLILLVAVAALALLGTLLEASAPILLMLAPIALAIAILSAPPLVIVFVVWCEFVESSLEIIRFQPVATAEMPDACRQWIARNTVDFEAQGFRLVGDFRLKERSEHFARVFINAKGDVLGEIAWTKALPWQTSQCCSFYSVMEDLTYLETGNLAMSGQTFEAPYILQSVPNATVADTLDAHRSRLAQLAEERQTAPHCFGVDSVEMVSLYAQKLCYARLKNRGVISRNPYDDVTLDFTARAAGDTSDRRTGIPLLDSVDDCASIADHSCS